MDATNKNEQAQIVKCPCDRYGQLKPAQEIMDYYNQNFSPSTSVIFISRNNRDEVYLFNLDTQSWGLISGPPHFANGEVFIQNSNHTETATSESDDESTEWHADRTEQELEGITLLGNQKTEYPKTRAPDILETFDNLHKDNDYIVTLDAYEFTSTCPKTGQPDFAKIIISYIPAAKMVESKSLKLYLFSYRNVGEFHEDCINQIGKDLVGLMEPKYLEVRGIFSPRGGISIYPFFTYVNPGSPRFKEIEKQRRLDVLRDGANRTIRYDVT